MLGMFWGTRKMCLWPGEDGWDYHFQASHSLLWEWTAEAVREIAEYDPETQIGLEYKHHEPRTHMLVSNAAKTALWEVNLVFLTWAVIWTSVTH